MKGLLFVGLGGAMGAMLRYGISMLPIRSEFPILTLSINILGAIAIGCIMGIYEETNQMNEHMLLFLKTGVCGGFTTFSTFSLEALNLFEKQRYVLGGTYVILSVICCLLGVMIGKSLSKVFLF